MRKIKCGECGAFFNQNGYCCNKHKINDFNEKYLNEEEEKMTPDTPLYPMTIPKKKVTPDQLLQKYLSNKTNREEERQLLEICLKDINTMLLAFGKYGGKQ